MSDSRLAHFPIQMFASTMGLFGLTLATHAAGLPSLGVFLVSSAVLVVMLVCYGLKAMRYPGQIAAEWRHPIKIAFFPAITISLLLWSRAAMNVSPDLARPVWIVAAAGQAGLTLAVIANWISARPFTPAHLNPAWFIPAVGNVIAPLAGVALGYVELSWYFFAVGVLFWVVLLTLLMNRLMFHDPMPGKLMPTLVILIAPPAVGFLSWVGLSGGLDAFGRVLYNVAVFFFLLVLIESRNFLRLPFALSFWALSFPIAGLSIASRRFAEMTGSGWHAAAGLALWALLAGIIAVLAVRTVQGLRSGDLLQPD